MTGIAEDPGNIKGNAFFSNGYLYIMSLSMKGSFAEIGIFNITGQNLCNSVIMMNDIVQVPAPSVTGMYILRVTSGSKSFIKKVIVKRR